MRNEGMGVLSPSLDALADQNNDDGVDGNPFGSFGRLHAESGTELELKLRQYLDKRLPIHTDTIQESGSIEEQVVSLALRGLPQWVPFRDRIHVSRCTEGITNQLFKLSLNSPSTDHCDDDLSGIAPKTVLVRVYGENTNLLIDRSHEHLVILFLSLLRLAPPIYIRHEKTVVYGYVPGTMTTPETVCQPNIARAVARECAKWHSLHGPGEQIPSWEKSVTKWLGLLRSMKPTPALPSMFSTLDDIQQEYETLRGRLNAMKPDECNWMAFSHNDLLCGNIVIDPPSSSSQDVSVSFIDYEYGGYNPRGFDLGNHFNEYAGLECNYDLFPSPSFVDDFVVTYLREYSTQSPSQDDIVQLRKEIMAFSLASHFFWGVWAILQSRMSSLSFDYTDYAERRFKEYFKQRDARLS